MTPVSNTALWATRTESGSSGEMLSHIQSQSWSNVGASATSAG